MEHGHNTSAAKKTHKKWICYTAGAFLTLFSSAEVFAYNRSACLAAKELRSCPSTNVDQSNDWLSSRSTPFQGWYSQQSDAVKDWLRDSPDTFRNWLAARDRALWDWFAARDEATRDYLATRDEAFLHMLDKHVGYPAWVKEAGGRLSEATKEVSSHIALEWKASGKYLKDRWEILISHLIAMREQCSDVKSVWSGLELIVNGMRNDLGTLMGGDSEAFETLGLAGLSLYIESQMILYQYDLKCVFEGVAPIPKFKEPEWAKLSHATATYSQ